MPNLVAKVPYWEALITALEPASSGHTLASHAERCAEMSQRLAPPPITNYSGRHAERDHGSCG
jgi:hypothetical protein